MCFLWKRKIFFFFILAKILLLLVAFFLSFFQIVDACCVILSFILLLLLLFLLSWGCRGMNFLELYIFFLLLLFRFENNKNFEFYFLSQKLINSEIMFLKFWIIFAKKFSFVDDVVISHSRNFVAMCVYVWTKILILFL